MELRRLSVSACGDGVGSCRRPYSLTSRVPHYASEDHRQGMTISVDYESDDFNAFEKDDVENTSIFMT